MDQSSSYKHLTVILAALLTTMVIAIIALVLLLSSPSVSDDPPDSAIGDSSTRDPSVISPGTSSGQPTTSTSTTDGSTPPATPGGDQTTVGTPTTEAPPSTDEPILPPVGPVNGSARGDKLGSMELYAEWNTIAYDPETGSCTLKLSLYCDSYSISLGPRFKNYLIINDDRFEFQTDQISIPSNDHMARTLLYSTEYEVQKDSLTDRLPIHIEFGWHYQGRYSGEFAEWLTLKADFVV